ncbi:MAG: tRNA (adenosine(37)-N6)-threonylcarbamoyltransferase complex ATPase subunit type 1 TsaE [Candidatus Omnitrophica bacterium]|nr:tRNA (adenosine(37)-N6)-threonylcarbamoyltransferase complex ATPase subunit type 1 TsaE [Candidatus Omnitrophota bacterium]
MFISKSAQETFEWGKKLGESIHPPAFIGLTGPLGAGKTLLVKAIAAGLGHNPDEVHSPTFTIMNIYELGRRMYHFDFYRLESAKDFDGLGLEEFFDDPSAVVVVEWAEKVKDLIPSSSILIHIDFGKSDNERKIAISHEHSSV